jgi:hypothetical protein
MRRKAQTGFLIAAKAIRNDIFIPRYYDPRIEEDLAALGRDFDLQSLGDLEALGHLRHNHGDYVPKLNYGTGPYPYIRTSDISNWELRASPKHGVARDVLDEYSFEQDVKAGDILVVHEGTYLIGTAAMVTAYDGPMLYQHHIAKLRVNDSAPITSDYLLAALGSPLVQRQIRSKQFSADIIDSVVGRLQEVIVPIPRDRTAMQSTSDAVSDALQGRARARESISNFLRVLENALTSGNAEAVKAAAKWAPDPAEHQGGTTFLGEREQFVAFRRTSASLDDDILIPKYYNPKIAGRLQDFQGTCDLLTIDSLMRDGVLALGTGDEIGRLSYGTGTIPFVRTSDLGTYELKADAKHGVDKAIWSEYHAKQDLKPGDLLLVRDGTYLVGSSSIVFEEDLPLLFCGGIYRLRLTDHSRFPPGLLYALLNLPVVKRQMRSKQFTRDVIDTLGHRLKDVVLPIPKLQAQREQISAFMTEQCQRRVRLRENLRNICSQLHGIAEIGAVSTETSPKNGGAV